MSYQQQRSVIFPMPRQALLAGLIACLGAAGGVHAEEDPVFSFGGFGTLGAVHSSSPNGDYVGTSFQPEGSGRTHDWSATVDSKIGAQLTAKWSKSVSAVAQVVAAQRSNGSFSPRLEWAYLKYALSPQWEVRVGRTVRSGFMLADTRLVGFANPWVRPPVETYNVSPSTNADGIDLAYRTHIGELSNRLQASYGQTKIDVIGKVGDRLNGVEVKRLRGFDNTIEYGALTARAAVTWGDLHLPIGGGNTLLAESRVVNLGARYEPGDWFVMGEATSSMRNRVSNEMRAYYTTAGVRLGKVTPYATYSKVAQIDRRAGLRGVDQRSIAAGLRWDAITNVAVKLQFDRVSVKDAASGFFVNALPALGGTHSNVTSVAVDFVY